MSADDRLRYCASQFDVVEVDATYYFPPSQELVRPVDRAHAAGLPHGRQGVLAADPPPRTARRRVWDDVLAGCPLSAKKARELRVADETRAARKAKA
jgi:hypothetical protein